MKNTLYLAYGSNLCIEQMAYRCPSATVVGNAILKNRRLIFSGTPGNCHASVVKAKGYSTPVLVWSITAECEKALDRYEGFPIYYRKESVYIQLGTSRRKAMLYVMNERPLGAPNSHYYKIIRDSYQSLNFDMNVLREALKESSGA